MNMAHGGRRPGAGRKSNAEIKSMRDIMDKSISPAQWQELICDLWQAAKKGNLRATQILLSYRFGDPYAAIPSQTDTQQIKIIHYVDDNLTTEHQRNT
jgi:hypothetical protein